jgi:hypothetical protein
MRKWRGIADDGGCLVEPVRKGELGDHLRAGRTLTHEQRV